MRLTFLVTLLAVSLPSGCALRPGARSALDDWARVSALSPGTEIVIGHVDPADPRGRVRATRGHFVTVEPGNLAVRTAAGNVHVNKDRVRRVDVVLNEPTRRRRGTFIGAAIGAIVGLGLTSGEGPAEKGTVEAIHQTTTAAGVAVGSWADALRDGRRTRLIYRRDGPRSTRISLAAECR